MPTPREKFQALLKKLFQFDCAELDFGIYRIMNHKRVVIERFIGRLTFTTSRRARLGAVLIARTFVIFSGRDLICFGSNFRRGQISTQQMPSAPAVAPTPSP